MFFLFLFYCKYILAVINIIYVNNNYIKKNIFNVKKQMYILRKNTFL